eukprot:scaffold131754_cov54-Phaeocystis_antarctica.AAC.3
MVTAVVETVTAVAEMVVVAARAAAAEAARARAAAAADRAGVAAAKWLGHNHSYTNRGSSNCFGNTVGHRPLARPHSTSNKVGYRTDG